MIILIFLSSCSIETKPDINVSVEIPFEIKVGEIANIEGHRFMFSKVSSDSRCPIDAQCIWLGEATIVLTPFDQQNKPSEEVSISTNSTDAYVKLFDEYGYLVQLNSLTPQPKVGTQIAQSDYIATLTIFLSA